MFQINAFSNRYKKYFAKKEPDKWFLRRLPHLRGTYWQNNFQRDLSTVSSSMFRIKFGSNFPYLVIIAKELDLGNRDELFALD